MNEDLLDHFLVEGRELTAQASQDLAALIRAPSDKALLDRAFRAVHTLKGSTGLFDLAPMGRVLHAAEDQLGAVRRDGLADVGLLSALIAVVDQVDAWLDDLERTGALPATAPGVSARLMAGLAGAQTLDGMLAPGEGDAVAIRYTPHANAYFSGDDPVAIIKAVPGLADLKVSPREPFGDLARYDPFTCNLVIEAISLESRAEVEAALRWVKDQVALSATVRPAPSLSEAAAAGEMDGGEIEGSIRTVRVEAARVDRLADLASELVIAKSGLSDLVDQIEQLPGGRAAAQALRAQQARMDRLVGDLHATVGKVRLTPLAPLFGRFPRLAREIARSLGKTMTFEIEGGEIEVDKAVVDGLFEPLLHALRNALDHGLEPVDLRRAAGKPDIGLVRLSARTVGDQVLIILRDDGAGIDPARIRTLAIKRGLIDAVAAEGLDERQAQELIFLPGFSTAAMVSDVSGRGVGMDAVRAAIARLGGRVEIDSTPGQGTSLRFLLPISMVLTKIMVVACGSERYGLVLDEVVETTRLSPDRIVPVRAGEAFQLREAVVPLVRLGRALGVGGDDQATGAQRVVVTRVGGELVGFAVDAIVEPMDAAVRPMGGLLAGARGMAGSTLLADGAVLMILDLQELVR
uniref:chemotaxis protein CheA n=1 Tax=uncultured Caulobacter sp. TaxID=158749 RepID=UPI0025D19B0C|nr:chemotaxis protein CheA [uncultured Caulobacter sp.]